MRALIRKIVLWALASPAPYHHDPTDIDKYAAENHQ